VNEDRVRALVRGQRAPDEQAAEQRALRVVQGAFAQRERAPTRGRLRRTLIAVAVALALLGAAFTPAGQAVTDWVREAVTPSPEHARPALSSLPAKGRVLVVSERGPWIVYRDGSKRLLGAYADASWSPGGLFVIATRGHELVALDPKGAVRWSLARPGVVRDPRWSPDGFRIAYRSGRELRVVAGDGTGDRLLAQRLVGPAPAWRPHANHELAFAGRDGRIRLVRTDTSKVVSRSAPGTFPSQLAWSATGERLLALSPRGWRLLDARGRVVGAAAIPVGERTAAAAFGPGSAAFAVVSYAAASNRSRLELVRPGGFARALFSGAGRFGNLAWSPDGRWLLAEWRDADQWLFIRARSGGAAGIERLRAVANISRQFDPGAPSGSAFPVIRGWCCAR
jgi:hypothetical protein